MYRLVETIKYHKGILHNISYHNDRYNRSRKLIFNIDESADIRNFLKPRNNFIFGISKIRVVYGKFVEKIEIMPYVMKRIKSLKIIENNEIEYKFKFEDRNVFDKLLEKREKCDDILIVNNGKVTDTSFCNVVFSDGKKFYTPSQPLLKGTKREQLLFDKIIQAEDISLKDLKLFKKAFLINAMIDIEDNNEILIENII